MIKLSKINRKQFYKPKEVADIINVSTRTIQNYCDNKQLEAVRTPKGHRLITTKSLTDFLDKQGVLLKEDDRSDVIYARVSSSNQFKRGDLDRQINNIVNFAIHMNPQNLLTITDIGSGLNDNRKGLNKLLELIEEDKVKRIFINYKDRLTRFGFNYIEKICKFHNVEIIIVSEEINDKSISEELAEDIISLIHSFSGKLYGMRNKIKEKLDKELSD